MFSTRFPTSADGIQFNNILFHQLAVVLRFYVGIITCYKKMGEKILDDNSLSGIVYVSNVIEIEQQ